MTKRIKRLVGGDLLIGRIDGADFIDGEYLHRVGPAHIRGDRVLILAPVELNRLRDLGKKIHDRRASQAESFFRKLKLEPLDAAVPLHLGDEEHHFDGVS